MPMNPASRDFIYNEDMERTEFLLANHLRYTSRARSYGLAENDEKRDLLLDPNGPYRDENPDDRRFLEDVLYTQLFDRVNQLIDDFAALCHALSHPLQKVPKLIVNAPAANGVFRQLDEATWRNLLRYGDLAPLDIPAAEYEFIELIRAKNIAVRMRFIERLQQVLKTYRHLHAKLKHGHLYLYAMEELLIDDERVVVIPVVYDSSDVDNRGWIVFTEKTYRVWEQLHNDLLSFSRDLAQRNLKYIRRRGIELVEHSTMFEISEKDRMRLERVVTEADEQVPEHPIVGKKRFLAPPREEINRQIKMMLDMYAETAVGDSLEERTK
ncbi:MAG: hypothetical protein R3A46_14990 [Thermomicrobiales bacterium]